MKPLFYLSLALLSSNSLAAPKAELWDHWNTSNESNVTTISHQAWQEFLDDNLVQSGQHTLLNYGKISIQDKKKLDSYIHDLSQSTPTAYSKQEQYAYWVNLYNALTVDIIVDNYPVSSITKLGGFFSFGPWDEKLITVEGKKLTLNDIEHRILRPIWQDPRTHYAVNCASLGCPNLQSTAFSGQNTEALLDKAAATFINSSKGVFISSEGVQLSSIYDWFAEDFGNKQELVNHLSSYGIEKNELKGAFTFDYDWNLNVTE